MAPNGASFTRYGWGVCLWALLIPFQYGYHISVLNQIQAVLTCKATTPRLLPAIPHLAECIPMTDVIFSLLTAIFTIGGLAGSLVAGRVMDSAGRRGANRICTVIMGLGTACMGLSNSVYILLLGRLLIGVASGLGLCVGPIYLAEIAPTKISGSIGVLTQVSIVTGIMLTQVAGLNLAAPFLWRYVFLLSFSLAVIQYLSTSAIVESPAFLLRTGRLEDHKTSAVRLWGNSIPSLASEESALLDSEQPEADNTSQDNVTIPQVFTRREYRRPLAIVCSTMLAQQVSGINAVLYYSNDILSKSLPELGAYISVGITVVNVIMTFPPLFLIDKLGRRQLLLLSTIGQLVSLVFLGYGLNSGTSAMSSIAILTFVMSFALGLGPIPFVIIPEVSPLHAVSTLSSVSLSVNWIVNFVVGLVFLPLRNLMSGGDMYKEGQVFYAFFAVFSAAAFWLFSVYRPSNVGL